MRQPRDLEELLTLSEEHDITLHGQANRRDLSDPDDRFFLRIEVAHACRSSDDTSRRLRDALEDRARDGRPHMAGKRAYGYARDAVSIIDPRHGGTRDTALLHAVRPVQWRGTAPSNALT
jgi:site-specific DNA recombinase